MSTNIAQACIDNMQAALQSIAKLTGKTIQVYTEDELLDKTKQISLPAAGVMYEGMRALPEPPRDQRGATTHRIGASCELVISIMIIESNGVTGSSNSTKAVSTELMDLIRDRIMGTKSPSGHFWRFIVEAAAEPKKGATFWIQRWATPVLLVPGNKAQDNPG